MGNIYSAILKSVRAIINQACIAKYTSYSILKRGSGISTVKREPPLIISLTSYPDRFASVFLILESLLNQTLKPDRIILWLAHEEVEQTVIPTSIKRLSARGVEIRVVQENIKSYKKIIHVLEQFGSCNIVTCDDDWIYPKWFLAGLYSCYQKHPDCISAYRCRVMNKTAERQFAPYEQWAFAEDNTPSYQLFPTTGGGALYPAGSLSEQVSDRIFLQLAPFADDVWLKAMSLLQGKKVAMVKQKSIDFCPVKIKNSHRSTLWTINQKKNDEQLKNVFDYFDLYDRF